MKELEPYKEETDQSGTLFTYSIYNMSPKEVVNKIKNHAEKCKSISNMHKRNLI